MFYSIAIPGILQAWPRASAHNERTTRPGNEIGSAAGVSTAQRPSQSRERAYTSMTMNKSTDSSDFKYCTLFQ